MLSGGETSKFPRLQGGSGSLSPRCFLRDSPRAARVSPCFVPPWLLFGDDGERTLSPPGHGRLGGRPPLSRALVPSWCRLLVGLRFSLCSGRRGPPLPPPLADGCGGIKCVHGAVCPAARPPVPAAPPQGCPTQCTTPDSPGLPDRLPPRCSADHRYHHVCCTLPGRLCRPAGRRSRPRPCANSQPAAPPSSCL